MKLNEEVLQEKVSSLEDMLSMTTSYMSDVENKLKTANDKIKAVYSDLLQSLNYASLIQQSIQPKAELLDSVFQEHCIVNRPKEIIGGDNFWVEVKENKIYAACLDCTGHGVPGAMLTVGAHFSLNIIFQQKKYERPESMLEDFNLHFYNFFSQKQSSEDLRQGLDIGLIIFDTTTEIINYCGTNISLIRINKDEKKIYRGNRSYIGNEQIDLSVSHSFNSKSTDSYFMHSDGVTDQFGGDRNKKLGHKRLENLLQNIFSLNMNKQREIIDSFLSDWKGSKEQTDDMLLLGMKFK